MSKKHKMVLLITIIVCISSIISILLYRSNYVPIEYKNLINQFLELREENNSLALELCYFKPENEFIKTAMLESGEKYIDCELKKIEKINDNLFIFYVRYELESFFEDGFSFVGTIEGKDYIIINSRDIPDSIKKL